MMKIWSLSVLRSSDMNEIICDVCPHHCRIPEGGTGFCRARKNSGGNNVPANYGRITSLALDPIEKKPLYGFYPGSVILSAGSYGCNMNCPFCQNYTISAADERSVRYAEISPEELVSQALRYPENIGAAFTYNEPMISWEYILDCASLLKKHGLKTVLVTNGCVNKTVTEKLLPYIDAMNIDLKGDREFYKELYGDYDTVKKTIETVYDKCHLEVTILLIPGKNDTEEFVRREAEWLSGLDPDIILHLTRYFPRRHYTIPPTDIAKMKELKKTADMYLNHVYLGNV